MVDVLRQVLQPLPTTGSSALPRLILSSPLPASITGSLAANTGTPLTAQVVQSLSGGASLLQLASGQVVEATFSQNLPVGTTLTLQTSGANPLVLLAKNITLPSVAAGVPQTPFPASNVVVASLGSTLGQLPTTGQNSVFPAGPLSVNLPTGTALQNLSQSLTATLTSTLSATGTQTATLTATGGQTFTATLQTATALPVGTTLTLALPAGLNTTTPTGLVLSTAVPQATPSIPPTTPNPLPLPLPLPTLQNIAVLQPNPALAVPAGALQLARVVGAPSAELPEGTLPPPPATAAGGPAAVVPVQFQPLVLSNGQRAAVQLPAGTALPNGSVLVLGTPQSAGTPLPVTSINVPQVSFTGGPIAASSAAAVPSGSTLVQGTITANLAGDPAPGAQHTLTLTTPAFAGQTITLSAPQALPLGTQLSLAVPPQAAGATPANTATPALITALQLPAGADITTTLTTLGRSWPSLIQALQTLAGFSPTLAKNATDRLPHTKQLLPGLVNAAHSILSNNSQQLLGAEATQVLQALGADFSADIASLSALSQGSNAQGATTLQTPDGWRGMLFPYIENPGDQPRQGGFFWRQNEGETPESQNTRFVVQLELSELGDVQLDGLLMPQSLWLKLRLKTPPDENLAAGLHNVVQTTLKSFGLEGGIALEITKTFDTNPVADLLQSANTTYSTAL